MTTDNLEEKKVLPPNFYKDVEEAREEIKRFVEAKLEVLHAMMPEGYHIGISLRYITDPKFVNESYVNILKSETNKEKFFIEKADFKFPESADSVKESAEVTK